MRVPKRIQALAWGIACVVSGSVQAGIGDTYGLNPYWNWKEIVTEHFRVTFPEDLTPIAQKTARYLEEAHRILSPELQWEPRFRVQTLVIDNADAANGLTSANERFGMLLYATPPDNWFSTAYYDDWLRLLVLHEYTHFLNTDATRGVWTPVRWLLQDYILPNAIWPTWMLEGLAVYEETKHTRAGRGRSTYYRAVVRSAIEHGVLDDPRFMTLDKVNGTNPTFPAGETPYLFGYQLMNQAASVAKSGTGPHALGKMSLQSAGRVPFFIDDLVADYTGTDWRGLWTQWVAETRVRAEAELRVIRSKPTSEVRPVTDPSIERSHEVLGAAYSPDGHWLAYTVNSADRWRGIVLEDRTTHTQRILDDKSMGATVSFTPDSQFLVTSELIRWDLYSEWSDLQVYAIPSGRKTALSQRGRLRDPQVSPDGAWVTYSWTDHATTGIGIAPLERMGTGDGTELKLGALDRIFTPLTYDRASTPHFSADGSKIYFSLHRNGEVGEELIELDRATRRARVLVSDGAMNRFPTIEPKMGKLFYTSDRDGVDNVIEWNDASALQRQTTNLTSGVTFPTFSPEGDLYGSVYSYSGWNLAQISRVDLPIKPSSTPIQTAPAPVAQVTSTPDFSVQTYSPWPSLMPRSVIPELSIDSVSARFGASVLGYDAIERHTYVGQLSVDTRVWRPNWALAYTNRSLGPSISFSGGEETTLIFSTGEFARSSVLSSAILLPIPLTHSTWTPALSFTASEGKTYDASGVQTDAAPWVKLLGTSLTYDNLRASPLAVFAEQGRRAKISSRVGWVSGQSPFWKLLLTDVEHFSLGKHWILSPSFQAAWAPVLSSYSGSNDLALGRGTGSFLSPSTAAGIDGITVRGYPSLVVLTQSVIRVAVDTYFPLIRLFGGADVWPFFAKNVYGLGFVETSIYPGQEPGNLLLPSAGLGVRASLQVLVQLPLTLGVEYHQGFGPKQGAPSDLFFQATLASLQF